MANAPPTLDSSMVRQKYTKDPSQLEYLQGCKQNPRTSFVKCFVALHDLNQSQSIQRLNHYA